MGPFDQNARLACKLNGSAFHNWTQRRSGTSRLAFDRWADARRLAVIPGLERIDDLVAVLTDRERPGKDVFMITEVELAPRKNQLKRLGVYSLLLSIEESAGATDEGEPAVGCCLLNLTGKHEAKKVNLAPPGFGHGVSVSAHVIDLASEQAALTLDEIAAGTTARCILPWVPLMAGGGDRELIERWKTEAVKEADADLRNDYAWFALVFAELTPGLVNWQQALEGWNVQESQLVNKVTREAERKGEAKALRGTILKALHLRLGSPAPESIRLAVEGTNDPETLQRWFEMSLNARTMREFAAGMADG